MATSCKYVYLDIYGNPSVVYESALAKYGPEQAENIYIRYMLQESGIRFSLGEGVSEFDGLQRLKDMSNKIKDPTNTHYRIQGGRDAERVTQYIGKLKEIEYDEMGRRKAPTETVDNVMAEDEKVTAMADNYLEGYLTKFRHQFTNLHDKDIKKLVKKMKKDKGPEYDAWIKHIKNRWKASQTYGNALHEMIERVLIDVQKARNKDPLIVGTNMIDLALGDILKEARNAAGDNNNVALREISFYKPMIRQILERIEEVESRMGLQPGQLIIKPEQKIESERLGLAGSVDLLLVNPRNNQVKIMDFKTKTEESITNFYRQTQETIGGVFDGKENNPVNKAGAQMSVYGAILEDNGFTIMEPNEVVVIKGSMNVSTADVNRPVDKQTFFYHMPEIAEIKRVANESGAVYESIIHGADYDALMESRRREGMQKTFDNLTGNKAEIYRDNEKDYVQSRIDELMKDKEGEWFYIGNDPTDEDSYKHRIHITNAQKEDTAYLKRIFVAEYKVRMKDKKRLSNNAVAYFDDDDTVNRGKRFGYREQAINNLLAGISPETHYLVVAETAYPQYFRDLGPDVLIAVRHDDPDAISIFSATSAQNFDLQFDTRSTRFGKRSATNLYGKYRTDAEMEKQDIPKKLQASATEHDIFKMKLAGGIMRMKVDRPNLKVEHMKVGSILGPDRAEISVTSMETELAKLKKFRELAPPEDMSAELIKLLDNPMVNNGALYSDTVMDEMYHIIENADYRSGSFVGSYMAGDRGGSATRIKENLEKRRRGTHVVDEQLILDFTVLYNNIKLKPDSEQKRKEETMVANMLLQLHNIKENQTQLIQGNLEDIEGLRSESSIPDYYINIIGQQRENYTQKFRMDFQEFNRMHQKEIGKLFEAEGINKTTGVGQNALWKKMMISPELDSDGQFKEDQKNYWMKLKNPDDMTNNLTEAMRVYIRFFNKHTKNSLMKTAINFRTKEGIEEGSYETEGFIPIMRAGKKISTNKGVAEFGRSFLKYFIPTKREYETKLEAANNNDPKTIAMQARFGEEVTDAGAQGGKSRNGKLGISNSTSKIPHDQIEMNLAAILTATAADGFKTEHLGILNTLTNAVNTHLVEMSRLNPSLNTVNTRKFLDQMNRMTIHDKFKNEGWLGGRADQINKAASTIVFTASYRQAMIEFFTAGVQGTSSMISQEINRFIMGTKDEELWFRIKDWAKAGKAWAGKSFNHKAHRMAEENGMLHPDPENLTDNNYTKHNKNRLMQSKVMWGLNTMSINNILVQTFMAYSMHKGIDQAYVQEGEDKNNYVYDETLDPRFYVYDPVLGLGTKPPTTVEDKKKHQLWKFTRNELATEGMIYTEGPKKGRMKIPMATTERKALKNYATRLFGSMSKDSIIFLDFHSYGRAISRYKRWFAQKISNYWTPRAENQAYQTRVWIQDNKFNPMLLNNVHLQTAEEFSNGSTTITIPNAVPLDIGDSLRFGSSEVEYKIEDIQGDKVTIAPPIEGVIPIDTPIFIKKELGYYMWKVEDIEGIIQTLVSVPKMIFANGISFKRSDMSRIQRENLSKFLSDMLMMILALTLVKMVLDAEDNEFAKTDVGKTISKAFTNAYGELNVIATGFSMTDSTLPAISTVANQMLNLGKGTIATATGNQEDATRFLNSGMNTFGSYRTVTELGGQIL